MALAHAVRSGTNRLVAPVISTTKATPVVGARTTATNSAPIPTAANADRGVVICGNQRFDRHAEQHARRGAHDKQRREQTAGKPGCIAERPEQESHREKESKRSERVATVEHSLHLGLAAADDAGPSHASNPTTPPTIAAGISGGTRRTRSARSRPATIMRLYATPSAPMTRPRTRGTSGSRGTARPRSPARRTPGDRRRAPHYGQRRAACRKRRHGDAQLETPQELLEHEDRACERRVECGSEARARAGSQQHPGIAGAELEHTPTQIADCGPHLHRRPFAAERHARPERQHAAEELDRKHRRRPHRATSPRIISSTRCTPLPELPVRSAGRASARRMPPRRRQYRHEPADCRRTVRASRAACAQRSARSTSAMERGADQPGQRADREARGREREQARAVLFGDGLRRGKPCRGSITRAASISVCAANVSTAPTGRSRIGSRPCM